ncbi:MAG: alpha-amylase [Gammaproteobacteria bacterium]|nr:alpha-amylase [Gammaproteobacteria bacterium]MBU1724574.1 alpha-amylase [Gammaproteobacteria bacterium]MBU2004617.1 alpha-amylase [Gammaproteobacteria bacterium]
MYEQVSHSLLNDIMIELDPTIKGEGLRHFYTRLGANFYSIHSLFCILYGKRDDSREHIQHLVETMARQYLLRPQYLRDSDLAREKDHNWFLSQEWVGMALYADGFAKNLPDLTGRVHYFQELGVNMVHLMPMMQCPRGASDGGYAISDFRQIDARFGTLDDVETLADELRKRNILLTLDVVLNHTSDEHAWAQQARAGDLQHQDYYYIFASREVPDMFEATMPEIFPETSPGNFTWDEAMGKWVMTVFNSYQWDLNYSNPAVFIEMLDIILFWANKGVDILRLDAVAFLWKKIGSICQNEREAHLILQLLKDCCQVSAPGVLFIAEAIVAPVEIIKYFGEDAINAKECEIAYNATFMALLWDAVATKNAKLLTQGVKSLPDKLERATWLNYIRCHDDIGLGFDDNDIRAVGYEPYAHRQFLIDYYTGSYAASPARGLPFGYNNKTGDTRISGSLASLVGLESAMQSDDPQQIDVAIKIILLLHGMTLSFGGIPLLYYGDEIGTLNDKTYLDDPAKANDSRWAHRPRINWDRAELRNTPGSIEYRLFTALKKMISVRKEVTAFADFNNRELLDVGNPHLFVFARFEHLQPSRRVLVVANFDNSPQHLNLEDIGRKAYFRNASVRDLYSGERPAMFKEELVIPPYRFYWLTDQ